MQRALRHADIVPLIAKTKCSVAQAGTDVEHARARSEMRSAEVGT